jgi:galactose oxidase
MNIPRAYEGDTLLSTGQVFTLGGSWYDEAGHKDGELFTPSGATGSWSRLPGVTSDPILTADPGGVYRADNHAWLFGWTAGTVFHAGPSRTMHWITTTGNGTIAPAGPRSDSPDAMNGNAVMYDVGKILTVGGATAYQDVRPAAVNTQATRRAYVVDITAGPGAPATTTRVSDMAYARAFCNSVVLPDGTVLVVGGQQHPQAFTDTGAALSPELWNPATGTFTVLAPDVVPRTYHSVAVLLPDGRVFSGGGGLCGTCTVNHPDGRIFTPPYLLKADGTPRPRPVLTDAPPTATPGSSITVTTDVAASFVLVRTSAVTHGVNNDQRRIPLTTTATNGTVSTLRLPADRGVVLPGTYLLFALGADGTPSLARFIRVA